MSHSGAAPAVVEDALRMISLVSCSANGNAAPPEARTPAELFWPRQTRSFLVHSLLMLSVSQQARTSPELLWPRQREHPMAPTDLHPHYGLTLTRGMHDAGYQYNRHVGAPLSVDQTPRPATQEEVWRHATEERFEEYQAL
ncbi:hypothetical protein EMIHUDRAFT_232082 [Emiliania huxleyi CCMP1516]|uniref:Uncharacterized protein n=2 Tax=Emiliania huxleyi TaxID=2903 RepID=A0A0D3K6C3_EMIH1|nr:hypothetical protein EMIHUDRAFT_232082 [Emiliania huxleyi CCMP1516]EOD31308.1 hypothetical protein EMIHUDRAFT_232082 [Emiliania huxleyi CCMP1516]|eukprot:XP_005783737.1 hypothetical protein EMIHUDRAFT_232082 [Emiliania huxleyi CCMP1516]